MKIQFTEHAWEEYLLWQQTDKRILRRINELIRDIVRDPRGGIGKPEPLKHSLVNCWSRRIDQEHRLVYQVEADVVIIIQCRYHY